MAKANERGEIIGGITQDLILLTVSTSPKQGIKMDSTVDFRKYLEKYIGLLLSNDKTRERKDF